ncbi:MAG: flagellar hook protein FlgE [Actinomycetota bacterium]
MSSALSGLRNHQLQLDVIGNDIANVSTVGFKGSTTVFSDVLSQTLNGATAPGGNTAGQNPAQVGLGSRLIGTLQSQGQGALQRTGRSTDLAIQGDGFFVVNDGDVQVYTRNGSFVIDGDGRLATIDGLLVQGWQADENGLIDTNRDTAPVEIQAGNLLPPVPTTTISTTGNLDRTVAIGETTTMGLTIFSDTGEELLLSITFEKTAVDQWTASAVVGDPAVAVTLTDNVLTFDSSGELTAPADAGIDIAGGAIAGVTAAIEIELGQPGSPQRITQFAADATATVLNQNGSAAGVLNSFDIGQDGRVVGTYSNGRIGVIGQLALASFTNPEGLERIGGAWRQSVNSGLPQLGAPGVGGRGEISAGTLEMSNVDLAEEFTHLIVAQRGFQGNARIITASDEILQEVVNLRR